MQTQRSQGLEEFFGTQALISPLSYRQGTYGRSPSLGLVFFFKRNQGYRGQK